MNNFDTILLKGVNYMDNYKLPSYADAILNIVEIVNNVSIPVKYKFNTETKIISICSIYENDTDNMVVIYYSYNNFELRKIKIKKLLNSIK